MDVEYWENLDTFLANVFREPTPHLEQELYYRLEDAKPRFLSLLDVPPRSSAEETELKSGEPITSVVVHCSHISGKATIGGQQKTYNNDFVQEALFLAAQLDCSERLAAGILDQVLSGYPNDDPVGSTIKAAQRFYSGRQHVLTTLQLVLNSAMGISAIHPAVQSKVADYIIALVGTTTTLSGGKQGTLGEKIIQQIDTCATLIQKHQASQRNADSTTVIGTFCLFIWLVLMIY